jgi:5-(carboxyamino)imidazole ribonucleotide synthase
MPIWGIRWPLPVPFQPLSSIGIVGGGQLALMLAEAAAELGISVHIQTPGAGDPAVPRAATVVQGALDDDRATRLLADRCGAISFENEWMPLERLYPLAEEGVSFIPGLDALAPLITKRGQRQLLDQFHLPCPRWFGLEQVFAAPEPSPVGLLQSQEAPGSPLWRSASPYRPPEVEQRPTLPPGFSFPLMAKASRGGYDGKGTVPVADQQALEALLDHVLPSDWILEEMVPFEEELALVACRDRQGNVACWPLVQTHQHQQICDWVVLPAPVNQAVQAFARNVAASLLTGLDYVGVLAIEFFYGPAGLQVNEIAPRTHNSGHVTIEACRCSQFAQQVRIVAGLPMGSTDSLVPGALMVNLLGLEQELSEQEQQERLAALAALPGAHLHWYGKAQAAPGRKLGHLTLVLEGSSSADRQGERDRLLAEVRRIWPLPEAIEPPNNPLE